ncbi:MAG: S-layer homology domain-containing protein [Patescibacteria group bacterium]
MQKIPKRLVLPLVVLFILAFGSLPILAQLTGFIDVTADHPDYSAISYLRARGIISGYGDGSFRPSGQINRAEFIAIVVKAKSVNTNTGTYKNCFQDVKQEWFADEVCYAKAKGWVVGYGKVFYPALPVSYAQAAAIAAKAFGGNALNINRGQAAQLIYENMPKTNLPVPPAAYVPPPTPPAPAPVPPVVVVPPPPPPAPPPPAPVTTSGGFPAHVFAPYVDVLLGDFDQFKLAQNSDNIGKYMTLAFIVSRGCEAHWGGILPLSADTPLYNDIAALRAKGGDVIISFGGANGIELAQACSTDDALLAQYQAVVTRYALKRIDFDIEGAAVADPTSRERRNRVLVRLKAANPGLQIQYTLPVLPTGLTNGVALLQDAAAKGFVPDIVNIMAMDYGTYFSNDMGKNATDAITATVAQLKTIFTGKTDAQLKAMVGVTPMIGANDVAPEVFTLADATTLLNFANQNGTAFIAMWSANRDKQCTQSWDALYLCTKITQQPFDFAKVFKAFTQ